MPTNRKTDAAENPGTRRVPPGGLTDRARMVGAQCLAFQARTLARKLTQAYEAHLADLGLTLPQFSLMTTIAAAEDDTLGAIADLIGLDPSTLTRNLQGLAREGWVEIVTVEKDQRKRAVWLTEAGARKLQAAMPAWDAAQREVMELVGPDLRGQIKKAQRAL
jgi:DNA-binding MarR family transcriptional regulator